MQNKVLDVAIAELDKRYDEGNFHSTGDIYLFIKEFKAFLLLLKEDKIHEEEI